MRDVGGQVDCLVGGIGCLLAGLLATVVALIALLFILDYHSGSLPCDACWAAFLRGADVRRDDRYSRIKGDMMYSRAWSYWLLISSRLEGS